MDLLFIEQKLKEIIAELEKEAIEVVMDESLDKKETNLRMKPLKSTRQVLENAMESIRMIDRVAKEEMER